MQNNGYCKVLIYSLLGNNHALKKYLQLYCFLISYQVSLEH